MKNIKAIFLDMDGTILHENNKASEYTKQVINQLREQNYKVFLATGRSYSEINQLVPNGFTVDGIISSNGTSGEIHGDNLFRHSLTLERVQKIVELAKKQHIYYEVFPFESDRISLKEDEDWMKEMISTIEPPDAVSQSEWSSRREAIKGKIDWQDTLPDAHFSKIYLFSPNLDKITDFRNHLVKNQSNIGITVSNSSRYNAETMPYHTDKGTGIKEMIDHYGIQQEETLVIGDSDNDRAMFNFGHHTVAMKNARQEIKNLTDDITEYTNEEDGAAHYLKTHLLDN